MPLAAVIIADFIFLAVLAVAAWAFIASWTYILHRWFRGRAVIAYRPRRPAPWKAVDLAVVAVIFLAAQACVYFAAIKYLGPDAVRPPAMFTPNEAGTQHATVQLIIGGNAWILLICGFSAIIAAPIVEEFLFRVMLQGWLASFERRHRRRMPTLRRLLPRAFLPIALASLVFAMMHFRIAGPSINKHLMVLLMAGNAAAGLLTLVLAVLILKLNRGATAADFGWSPGTLLRDVRLGLTAFGAVCIPLFTLQYALILLMPDYVAADPIPLFFFSCVLGALYYRTNSIVPAIVLHASLNATSFLAAWILG